MSGINLKLLPIKLHYFLRFAATASLGLFLPLIIREKGVPPQGIGLLWTILPFVAFFTNSLSGWVADALKIHKLMFLLGLLLLTFGSTAIYFLPSVDGAGGEKEPWIFFNRTEMNARHMSFENTTSVSQETSNNKDQFIEMQTVSGIEITLIHIVGQWPFWILFFSVLMQHVGLNVTIIFTDAVCFRILGPERHKYGEQRMWGTIGMGIFSILIGALVDWHSKGMPKQDYLPAFIICFIFMIFDMILVSRMNIQTDKRESLNFKLLGKVLGSSGFIIFLVSRVIVYGFTLGINWTFRLMLVEDAALDFDPHFSSLKLLQGILMFVETFGGELPFLFYSGEIILRFGHEVVFIFCFLSVSLRYFLYFLLPNPWMFLPVEILNGPAYGLLHANMVDYGTCNAPPGSLATVHAIIRGCISAGQAMGGMIGGILYHRVGGRRTFLISSQIVLVLSIIYVLVRLLLRLSNVSSSEDGGSSNGRNEIKTPDEDDCECPLQT